MRGTKYSRQHDYHDADLDAEEYWDFTLKEMAESDIPAMVQKIFDVSASCKKVTLMGHSLGTNNIVYSLAKSKNA